MENQDEIREALKEWAAAPKAQANLTDFELKLALYKQFPRFARKQRMNVAVAALAGCLLGFSLKVLVDCFEVREEVPRKTGNLGSHIPKYLQKGVKIVRELDFMREHPESNNHIGLTLGVIGRDHIGLGNHSQSDPSVANFQLGQVGPCLLSEQVNITHPPILSGGAF